MKSEDIIWHIFGVPSMKTLREEDDAIEEYFFDHDWSKEQVFEYYDFKADFITKYGDICANLLASGYFLAISAAYFASPFAKADLVSMLMLGTFTVSSAIFARNLQEKKKLSDSYNQKNESLGITFVKKR
ncbi:MAG TPA: hypothetical protein IAB35_01220 [Candidatus Faecimonas gallistercoris]|nr:hypothetical protein [Candidatus Faecimonas gallistercoris]